MVTHTEDHEISVIFGTLLENPERVGMYVIGAVLIKL